MNLKILKHLFYVDKNENDSNGKSGTSIGTFSIKISSS